MKKIILIILISCFAAAGFGQNFSYVEYFIDEDPGYGMGINVPVPGGADLSIDFETALNSLDDGLHTIFVRARQDDGSWSHTINRSFLKQRLPVDVNPEIVNLEYFFDSDPGFGQANPVELENLSPLTITANLPLESLNPGLHSLYVRSKDENGRWSIVMQRSFVVSSHPNDPPIMLMSAEYFIDSDPGPGNGEPIMFDSNNGSVIQQFEATLDGYETGEHRLYVRSKDENGSWSIIYTETFEVEEPPIIAEFSANVVSGSVPLAVQFTDETYISEPEEWLWDFGDGNTSTEQNPQHTYSDPGTYTVSLTATSPEGTDTEVKEDFITVFPPLYSLEYFFDEDPGYGNGNGVYAYSSNLGGFDFLIPMNELDDGYHLLFVRVRDTAEVWTQTFSRSILKTRLPHDRSPDIAAMEYFLDDDPGFGLANSLPVSQSSVPVVDALISLDGIDDGLHNIFVRSQDENGRWSETFVRPFLKSFVPGNIPDVARLEYFIDADPGTGNGSPVDIPNPQPGIERSFVVNLNGLVPGEHRLFVRAIDERGHWSIVYNELFEVTASGAVFMVQLPVGWSGISSYIIPDDAAIENIFAPVQDELVILQNFQGMYWPTAGVNTLGNWNHHAGYQIKMETAQQLTFSGEMQDNLTANLSEGWNYLPVLNACNNDVEDLFAPVFEYLQIVKEVAGWGVYWPQFGVNTLGEILPGKAYFVLVDEDVEVEFAECPRTPSGSLPKSRDRLLRGGTDPASEIQHDKDNQFNSINVQRNVAALCGGTPFPSRGRVGDGVGLCAASPLTHTIALPLQAISGFAEGSIITLHNQFGLCCGAAELQKQNLVLTVFGDDPTTPAIDGMTDGEVMNFRIFNPETGKESSLELIFDEGMPQGGYFANHGLSAIKRLESTGVDEMGELGLNISVYPNPSSGIFQVSSWSSFSWEVSNTRGSIIATGKNHSDDFTIDLSSHPKGIYYLKISQGGLQTVEKLVVQ